MTTRNSAFVVFIAAWFVSIEFAAAQQSHKLTPVWQRQLGKEPLNETAFALAYAKREQSILIAGIATPMDPIKVPSQLWVRTLSANGDILRQAEIENPQGKQSERNLSPRYPYIPDAFEVENGDRFLVVEFDEGHPSLVKLKSDGATEFVLDIRLVAKSTSEIQINKIVPVGEHIALLGWQGQFGFIMELDYQGGQTWQKSFRKDGWAAFVDGVATKDDGLIVTGSIVTADKTGKPDATGSKVWVVRCASDGNITSEDLFLGRFPGVCRTSNDGCAIVYNRSNAFIQDISVRSYDSNMKQPWETQIESGKLGLGKFKIIEGGKQELIVVGSLDYALQIDILNNDGKILSKTPVPIENKTWTVDGVISTVRAFYVIFPVLKLSKENITQRLIGVAKFSLE